jgi:glycosyltransferase involved in cell wall biosynthesis
MVMIEALAAGTPVVATPYGSVPEIVEEGVTGFVRASPRALAAAVVAVDRLDRDACRAAAATRFSSMRMVRDHVRVYETVLDAGVSAALTG